MKLQGIIEEVTFRSLSNADRKLFLEKHGWSESIPLPALDTQQQAALDKLIPTLNHEIELGENFKC